MKLIELAGLALLGGIVYVAYGAVKGVETVDKQISSVFGAAGADWQSLQTQVGAAANDLGTGMSYATTTATNAAANGVGAFANYQNSIYKAGYDAIGNAAAAMSAATNSAYQGLGSAVNSAYQGAVQYQQQVWNAETQGLTNMWNMVSKW